MSELRWFDYVRGVAVLNPFTAVSYLTTAILFWAGWKLTGKIKGDWLRILIRAGLVAIAFAPAIFIDPGGLTSVIPASLAAIGGTLLYGCGADSAAANLIVYPALISMLLIWCIGSVVGGVSMKLREKHA